MNYEGSGDIFLTFYNGNTVLENMPTKNNPDNLGFERAECDKGASISWDYQNWGIIITNLKESKTKCKVYFSSNLANDYLIKLAEKDTTYLTYDYTNDANLRYIFSTPKNYIDIGDRETNGNKILWRIIGVMNNMTIINEDGSENTGQSLVKIIRADNIGRWSWDSSADEVNRGYGVNEWSEADLMTTLNFGAYWNKESGQCYSGENNKQTACDFSSIGLTPGVKDKLVKVRWNTGTLGEEYNTNNIKVNYMYQAERSENNGKKFCSGGNYCNDKVERKTTWDGYIGLIYPSDYGYAVGDKSCLDKTMSKWSESSPNCKGNGWLIDDTGYQWTITSVSYGVNACYVFYVASSGFVEIDGTKYNYYVHPVAYLKPFVKIKTNSASDYGSKTNPFELES